MKSKKLLLVFVLFLAAGIVIQFVSYDYVLNYLKKDFSSDGIIQKDTYSYYKSKFLFVKLLFIVIPLICLLYVIFQNKIAEIISYVNVKIPRIINTIYSKISISHLFWFSIVMVSILSVYAIYHFDIGQDEAFYLNDIQNINTYGSVYRDYNDNKSFYYDIPHLPLMLISKITVPVFGFSVVHIRIIILLFSLLMIPVLLKLFDKLTARIAIIFLFLFPGIFSLTATVFLEFTAILFFILSLVLLKEFEVKNKNYLLVLSAFFMSISMSTKIQFAVWIVLILIILLLIEYKRYISIILKYSFYIFLIYACILVFSFLHYGFHNGVLLFKEVFIGGNQSELLNIDISLIIYKFMMLNNLIYIPLLLFIWVKSWRIIKKDYDYLYMKIIFVGAISILIYWNLFYHVLTLRNVILGIAFNLMLMAIYLKENYKSVKLILIPYIIAGVTANFAFIQNGVNNDIQLYDAHLLDNLLSLKTNDDQKIFYSKVAEIIKPENDIYVPLQAVIPRLYLNNRTIKDIRKYKKTYETQYLIITPADIKEHWIELENVQGYISESKKILQVGNHILYQLP